MTEESTSIEVAVTGTERANKILAWFGSTFFQYCIPSLLLLVEMSKLQLSKASRWSV